MRAGTRRALTPWPGSKRVDSSRPSFCSSSSMSLETSDAMVGCLHTLDLCWMKTGKKY